MQTNTPIASLDADENDVFSTIKAALEQVRTRAALTGHVVRDTDLTDVLIGFIVAAAPEQIHDMLLDTLNEMDASAAALSPRWRQ